MCEHSLTCAVVALASIFGGGAKRKFEGGPKALKLICCLFYGFMLKSSDWSNFNTLKIVFGEMTSPTPQKKKKKKFSLIFIGLLPETRYIIIKGGGLSQSQHDM